MKRASHRQIPALVQRREPFNGTTNNGECIRARTSLEGYPDGRLNHELRWELRQDYDRVRYVVYSFETPIMWVLDDGTIREPDVTYSARTTRHQSLVRQGLGPL